MFSAHAYTQQVPAINPMPGYEQATLPARTVVPDPGRIYDLSSEGILTVQDTATGKVQVLNRTLPVKVVYPFTDDLRDPIFAYGIDPNNPNRIAVTTPRGIHLTLDRGQTWTSIPTENEISPNIHFTSIAISPFSPNGYLAGTSFDGMYETVNGGKTWKSLTEKTGFLGLGSGFYEEVSALAYDPSNPDNLYLATGFGGALYRHERKAARWTKLDLPVGEAGKTITHLEFNAPDASVLSAPAWELCVETERSLLAYRPLEKSWERRGDSHGSRTGYHSRVSELSPGQLERRARAEGRTGIYLNAEQARASRIDAHLKFMEDHGMNSLVVDFKDDFGYLTYDTALPLPAQAKAVNTRFKASELIKKVHDRGMYLIARIVVFKDRQLYRYDGNRFALWDRISNRAWGDMRTVTDPETGEERQEQLEFWVDPYSEDVWNYNVAIAQELQNLGVDEIQFDYIRFPSDGDTSRIRSRYQREGMTRTNALESFLARARSALTIPMGTDVYGFNAWFRMKYIGQDIGVFSRYVDVISPMTYPSHFPRDFLQSMAYLPRAEYLYKAGTDRAVVITGNRSLIRPYVQSFLIGGELKFEKPTYTDYLTRQLNGIALSAGSGFTLWNASGRYYMVTPDIGRFTGSTTPAVKEAMD